MNRNENKNLNALLHWTIKIFHKLFHLCLLFLCFLLFLFGENDDDEQKRTKNILLHTRDYAVCVCAK